MIDPLINLDAIAQKRDLSLMLKRRAALKEANGLLFYRPHAKQDLFHRAGKFKRRFVRTGNRFGKSTMGAAEDCAWALGERIWYDKGDPARTEGLPGFSTKGVIICADWDKAEEIFTDPQNGKLSKLLPKSRVLGMETNQSGNVDRVKVECLHGGISTIYLDTVKSYLNNPMGHESSDWDWVHIDEPCPEEMYSAYARGLVDREGSAWFTCTPITELWINEMFFPSGRMKDDLAQAYEKKGTSRWVITGSIYDNTLLKKSAIDTFESEMPAKERASRLHGKPLQLAGAIYDEFDDSIHEYQGVPTGWVDAVTPPDNWTIRYAVDIHDAIPQAVLFAATGPLGHVYFFAENFDEIHIGRACKQIKETLKGRKAHTVIADPRAWNPNPRDSSTIADDFHAEGIFIEPASKDLTRGIIKVKEFLKKRDRKGHPIANFSPTLTETRREFERYVYDPKTGRPHTKAPDHMMENLYRLVINGLDWVDPEADNKQTIVKSIEVKHQSLALPKVDLRSFNRSKLNLKLHRYGRRD